METLAYLHLTLAQEQGTPPWHPSSGNRYDKSLTAPILQLYSDPSAQSSLPLSLSLFSLVLSVFVAAASGLPAQAQTSSLRRGSVGSEVTEVQDQLATLGYFTSDSTGFFGPLTEEAVLEFQRDQGLSVDGVVGAETRSALFGTTTILAQSPAIPASLSDSQTAQLQADLATLGYYASGIDGIYGPLTEAAVQNFQADYDLPITGIVDIDTLTTIARAIGTLEGQTAAEQNASEGARVVVRQNDLDSIEVAQGSESNRIVISQDPQSRTYVETIGSTAPLATIQTPTTNYTAPVDPTIPYYPPTTLVQAPDSTNVTPIYPAGSYSYPNPGYNSPYLDPYNPTFNPAPFTDGGVSSVAPVDSGFIPYVVAVPDRNTDTLNTVRQFNPNAFLAGSSRGAYVNAGSFVRREDAENFARTLRQQGLDARVVYRPR